MVASLHALLYHCTLVGFHLSLGFFFLHRLSCVYYSSSIGAAVQGWDQTGSNGANLGFPQEFGIGSGSLADEWLVGVVNAGPYLGSAGLGCWLSDPLNNMFGRRGTIFITALVLIATPIGCVSLSSLLHTKARS